MVSLMSAQSFAAAARGRPDYGMQIEVLVALIYHFLVDSGDAVIDGGVAGAAHTVPLAKLVAPSGMVYGFEASPRPASWLVQFLVKRGVAANVDLRAVALGDREGVTDFIIDIKHPGRSHVRAAGDPPVDAAALVDKQVVAVRMATLDKELVGCRPITFIKLDLEGMDFLALRGGRELLKRDRPIIVFEDARASAARRHGYTQTDYFDFFDDIGYDVYDLHNTRVTPTNWRSAELTYESFCGPRDASDLLKIRTLAEGFWATIENRPVLNSWKDTSDTCLHVLEYLCGNR